MDIDLGHVALDGVAQQPLDGELFNAGTGQTGGECVPAPVGGGVGTAQLLRQRPEQEGSILRRGRTALLGNPVPEIAGDLGVDRDDAGSAGICLTPPWRYPPSSG